MSERVEHHVCLDAAIGPLLDTRVRSFSAIPNSLAERAGTHTAKFRRRRKRFQSSLLCIYTCSPRASTTRCALIAPARYSGARSANSGVKGAGWWSSDASHYFHTVTYHLDLVAALQSRGLGAAAAEALLESRPLFCFTAEAMALRDTDVRLQVCRLVCGACRQHALPHRWLIFS